MGVQQSKVSNRTGGVVHVLIFDGLDLRWFQDLRQPPTDGRPIELDGSDDGAAICVGVIHNEVGGRYVFDLFRLCKGATLIIKKVSKACGVQDYEPSKGVELLSLGRTISMSASRSDWILNRRHSASTGSSSPSPAMNASSTNSQEAAPQDYPSSRTE